MLSDDDKIISKMEVIELSGGGFFVARGKKYAHLSKDEAMFAIATFLVKKEDHHWMKSKEERETENKMRMELSINRIEKDLRYENE